mgnify:CR=1 FL=1
MNGEATEAPDKRFGAGALPATSTTSCGCVFCDLGLEPVKLRRQYVHYSRRFGIAVCNNTDPEASTPNG